jgi:hypothetical protein
MQAISLVMGEFKDLMKASVLCADTEGQEREVVPFVAAWLADGAEIPRLTHTPAPPHILCHICDRPNQALDEVGFQTNDTTRLAQRVQALRKNVMQECWDFARSCVKPRCKDKAKTGLQVAGLQMTALPPSAAPIYSIFNFQPSMQV